LGLPERGAERLLTKPFQPPRELSSRRAARHAGAERRKLQGFHVPAKNGTSPKVLTFRRRISISTFKNHHGSHASRQAVTRKYYRSRIQDKLLKIPSPPHPARVSYPAKRIAQRGWWAIHNYPVRRATFDNHNILFSACGPETLEPELFFAANPRLFFS